MTVVLWAWCSRCTGYRPILDAFKVFAKVEAGAYTEEAIAASLAAEGAPKGAANGTAHKIEPVKKGAKVLHSPPPLPPPRLRAVFPMTFSLQKSDHTYCSRCSTLPLARLQPSARRSPLLAYRGGMITG